MTSQHPGAARRQGATRRSAYPSPSKRLAAYQRIEASPAFSLAPESTRAELQLRKWMTVRSFLEKYPFSVSEYIPRDTQWYRVLCFVRETVPERALIDWLCEQIHIAENRAAGIPDTRPRKDGPCYDVLMEQVRAWVRKAKAVYEWSVRAENEEGGPMPPAQRDTPPDSVYFSS